MVVAEREQIYDAKHASERHAQFGVDTIIRMHDINLLHDLDRALFSLFYQTYPWISPIVVVQGFSDEDEDRARRALMRYDWLRRGVQAQVVNVANPEKSDLRSKLLNEGIASAHGRYITVLDCDDYLYGSAIDWLVRSLEAGKYTIGFGDIALKHVAMLGSVSYVYSKSSGLYRGDSVDDLLRENFCPIHSFIIDRKLVEPSDLYFSEAISRLEDYDFLMRICSKYPANFHSRSKVVGVYNWKSDGTNSTVTGFESAEEIQRKNEPWENARRHIERTRELARQNLGSGLIESARR